MHIRNYFTFSIWVNESACDKHLAHYSARIILPCPRRHAFQSAFSAAILQLISDSYIALPVRRRRNAGSELTRPDNQW